MANINPFISGTWVTGNHFVNREEVRADLRKSLESVNNVILMSPRRWGKTSLINTVENDMANEKDYVFIKFDAYFSLDEQAFFEKYAEATLKALKGRFSASLDSFIQFFTNSSIGLSIDPTAGGGIDLSINSKQREFTTSQKEDILNLPERIAKKKNLKVIFCIDDFQQTDNWKSKINVPGLLRGVWQGHKNVCYCLYGSHLSMMNYLFNAKSSPFYRFGKLIQLKRIKPDILSNFIIDRVKFGRKSISKELAEMIVVLAESNSYYVQDIAKEAYNKSEVKAISEENIMDAVDTIVESSDGYFRTISSSLTANHKKFLKVFCRHDDSRIYTKEFIELSELGYSSHVSKVVHSLIDKGILFEEEDKLEFEDPIYKKWILKKFY